ncbi:glutamyl-tRNA(Gln) amidotransferase subunit C, chloroplastic/mitochondrial [Jatropha curcas]|uniref:glutamyl-tRNA(Gln) amidotransferase subunit C, chloroplastic/mitochondrial n=1 Tax=Jatropha curcas TaxID=180498 RepID=UPI0005FB81B1|nr:glutamyl-tRNA(Gln) amidotransferase subunit C, chloroplastic/mitochondrial [Jatropha curcas]
MKQIQLKKIKEIKMGSKALLLLKIPTPLQRHQIILNYGRRYSTRSTTNVSSLQPPDLPRLAETARISLAPNEVEEFAPKIRQVIDWFGQLQAVDLNSVEPAIRADSEGENLRDDIPETYDKREAAIAGVPSYEDPYIKVPKVLNKE